MPKGEGLSRSGRAVINIFTSDNKEYNNMFSISSFIGRVNLFSSLMFSHMPSNCVVNTAKGVHFTILSS